VRNAFGPKMEEITIGFKKLHNEELHICTAPNTLRAV
jgi:hypothetical protein